MFNQGRICAALLALLPAVLHAGVVIETVERVVATGKETPQRKMYVQGGIARIEAADGEVVLFKNDSLIQIDPSEKTYRVMDKATIEKMASTLGSAMQAMQASMAKMSPEQRAAMEKMMGGMGGAGAALTGGGKSTPSTYEAVDAGRSENVNGRSCRVWNMKRDGKVDQEFCLVPYTSLPGREDLQALVRKMSALVESLQQALPTAEIAGEMRAYTRLNGYPVRQRDVVNGKPALEEDVLKSWTEQSVPAALFEIPAGYTRKDVMSGLR